MHLWNIFAFFNLHGHHESQYLLYILNFTWLAWCFHNTARAAQRTGQPQCRRESRRWSCCSRSPPGTRWSTCRSQGPCLQEPSCQEINVMSSDVTRSPFTLILFVILTFRTAWGDLCQPIVQGRARGRREEGQRRGGRPRRQSRTLLLKCWDFETNSIIKSVSCFNGCRPKRCEINKR